VPSSRRTIRGIPSTPHPTPPDAAWRPPRVVRRQPGSSASPKRRGDERSAPGNTERSSRGRHRCFACRERPVIVTDVSDFDRPFSARDQEVLVRRARIRAAMGCQTCHRQTSPTSPTVCPPNSVQKYGEGRETGNSLLIRRGYRMMWTDASTPGDNTEIASVEFAVGDQARLTGFSFARGGDPAVAQREAMEHVRRQLTTERS
jgi:hypothetical protein